MVSGERANGGKGAATGPSRGAYSVATETLAAPDSFQRPPFNDVCALEILSQAFATTVNAFATAVFVTDLDGLVVHLNAGAQRISGSSPELACGRHIADLLYTPLNAELRDHRSLLEAARKQGHAAMRFAIPISTHRGEMQLVDYHAIPLTDPAGMLIGGLFIADDFRQFEDAVNEAG